MSKPFFMEEFPSEVERAGEIRQHALTSLMEHGWISEDQRFYAQLCLEEALVNAVTHGNNCDPARKVRVEMAEEGDECVIRVYDEGVGFAPEDIHIPDAATMNGRGICLIRHCMDKVVFDREAGCLVMRMRRKELGSGGDSHGQ